ncbi:uncharacterized protein G2W53_038156 [Senna tora]|uniref:Uncharacterized protein n=1 Tax=Senna tora TaxID=362788 RepID=A0A834SNM9_9FABA|nr:uncharacterized protein G2W53_038156 [Senna tora]
MLQNDPRSSVVGSTPPAAASQPMSPFYQGGGGGYLSSLIAVEPISAVQVEFEWVGWGYTA